MLSKRAWRFGLAAVLAGASVSLAVSTPAAASTAATVRIDGPADVTAGQEVTYTFTLTAEPVTEDTFAVLSVTLPRRMTAQSASTDGGDCFLNPDIPREAECGIRPEALDGAAVTVDVVAMIGPGDELTEAIQAQFQAGDADVISGMDVHMAGTPSGLGVAIDAPETVEFGQEFTITVTGTTDHPVTDGRVAIDAIMPERLAVERASAPGLRCVIQDFDKTPGAFSPSAATCSGTSITDSVTMTLTVSVRPGHALIDSVHADFTVNNSSTSDLASLSILGSFPTATISGLVWNDLDRDGRQDPGEPPVADASVRVQFGLGFTEVDADGRYTIPNVELGEQTVQFFVDKSLEYTEPNVGDDEGDSDVVTSHKDCADCNIGEAPVTVSGPMTVDAGVFDPEVPPTSGDEPNDGSNDGSAPPAASPGRDLANTGVPTGVLVGVGVGLLVIGVGLTVAFRRRRLARSALG